MGHMDQHDWDERYLSKGRLWSGEPNGPLVDEITGMPPGRALDAGCGEGGDAAWLARQGWRVTATDISQVAIDRARAAAQAEDIVARNVTWVQADLARTAPEAGAYDLVTAHYFPLLREPGDPGARNLLGAVAPGGTLLFAGHDMTEHSAGHDHAGHDAAGHDASGADHPNWDDYYMPADLAALLDDGWTIAVHETRPRSRPAPEGTHHVHDIVLRAVRANIQGA